jgi:signal recognition particle subunit SRP54
LHIDEQMMKEIKTLQNKANPIETLFVVDSMTGQDAAHTAKVFASNLDLTGIILTKTDGDARGGAALSVKYITGKPIKFLCNGEKIDALEEFHPKRLVSRLLGMGDFLSLVEEISRKVDHKKAQKSAKKIISGRFDLSDMREQILQMEKMGGMEALIDKLPGMNNIANNVKSKMINSIQSKKIIATIDSMTHKERTYVKLIKGSRKMRIANGSGSSINDVNKTIKQFEKMQKQMKKMGGSKMKKMMAKMSTEGNMSDIAKMNNLKSNNKFPFS